MTDLKKPQPDDVTGHMLLEYSREDYLDSGMEPGERGAPISIGEAERAVEMYFFDYEELIAKFLLRRVERLTEKNAQLRKLQTDEAIKNRRLEKELRDLKATLGESAANGGTWLV